MIGGKILMVEDETRIATTLKSGLVENGYQVEIAPDAFQALDFLNAAGFDLIIIDINLPGMNGIELSRQLRSQNPDLPIIMLTALSTLQDKIEGYEAGADDYMIKPFEFKELLMKIRVLFRRAGPTKTHSKNILTADDLELNLDSKEALRGETAINLTAKEFQLLEFLLTNKNRVVSRADIALHVWDIDFDTNTNVIDVYINYLRNKVDKPFSKKLIQTQIGVGYVLKDA